MIDAEETRRRKAKELRYRRPIVQSINFAFICEDLYEIMNECTDVSYWMDIDDETLINALDGNEDEAFEFKMMFSDLCAECENMGRDLEYQYVPECFDRFFVGIDAGRMGGGLLGWDSYEQDYLGLEWDEYAVRKSKEYLKTLKKDTLIEVAGVCFRIYHAYMGLRNRYDNLKSAMDILRDQNTGYLQMVREIEELYTKANEEEFCPYKQATKDFDRMLSFLPQEAWIQ
ncbi:hypothetical protein [Candidatus Merdisoma sp. JLR.KK006]|uniref:hypothetical protein n=1 Tax=Candidatus Merdisoma sp. JLR.KK006 TaxID=3112626 RepID=UPI002FF23BE1